MAQENATAQPEAPLSNVNTTDIRPMETTVLSLDTPAPEAPPVAPEAEAEAPKAPNPREDALKAIYANRQKQLEDELGLASDVGLQPREEPAPQPEAPIAEPPAQAQPKPEAQPQPQPNKRILKVHGREIALSDDELMKAAQLGLASQQTFQDAARLRQEAEALRAAPQQNPAQQPVQQPQPLPPRNATQDLLDADKAKDLARRISYGTEEEGAKALVEYGNAIVTALGRPKDGPTPEQIAAYATQQAIAHQEFQTTLQTVNREYPEIFADRGLTLTAADYVQALRHHYQNVVGEQKSTLDLYREALGMVKARYRVNDQNSETRAEQPKPAATQAQVSQTRIERKRAAPQPPAAVNRTANLGEEPKAPSKADVVNWMRQKRGQPVLQ